MGLICGYKSCSYFISNETYDRRFGRFVCVMSATYFTIQSHGSLVVAHQLHFLNVSHWLQRVISPHSGVFLADTPEPLTSSGTKLIWGCIIHSCCLDCNSHLFSFSDLFYCLLLFLHNLLAFYRATNTFMLVVFKHHLPWRVKLWAFHAWNC